jgi:nicotinamidase-related amidase
MAGVAIAHDRGGSYKSLGGQGKPGEESMFRKGLMLSLAVLAAVVSYAAPSPAQTIIDEWSSVKVPPPPALKPATLDPKTTALLVIDLIKQTCNDQRRPRCVASIPKIETLLAAARVSGVTVIYTLFPSPSPATFPNPVIGDYLPAVAPKGDEPVVTAFVDKFMLGDKDTGLQKILKDKGITTLVPVGTVAHNGVLFTSVLGALRGFHVVVPVDGMSGNNAYEEQATAYILTTSIVYKVTLTSIDMIKFQ